MEEEEREEEEQEEKGRQEEEEVQEKKEQEVHMVTFFRPSQVLRRVARCACVSMAPELLKMPCRRIRTASSLFGETSLSEDAQRAYARRLPRTQFTALADAKHTA